MPNPVGINSYVTNFFSPGNLYLGVAHSINNIGGLQEFISTAERNNIPMIPNSASAAPYNGFTLNDDKWSSGRRRVGMMAYVIEEDKLYSYFACPQCASMISSEYDLWEDFIK